MIVLDTHSRRLVVAGPELAELECRRCPLEAALHLEAPLLTKDRHMRGLDRLRCTW